MNAKKIGMGRIQRVISFASSNIHPSFFDFSWTNTTSTKHILEIWIFLKLVDCQGKQKKLSSELYWKQISSSALFLGKCRVNQLNYLEFLLFSTFILQNPDIVIFEGFVLLHFWKRKWKFCNGNQNVFCKLNKWRTIGIDKNEEVSFGILKAF